MSSQFSGNSTSHYCGNADDSDVRSSAVTSNTSAVVSLCPSQRQFRASTSHQISQTSKSNNCLYGDEPLLGDGGGNGYYNPNNRETRAGHTRFRIVGGGGAIGSSRASETASRRNGEFSSQRRFNNSNQEQNRHSGGAVSSNHFKFLASPSTSSPVEDPINGLTKNEPRSEERCYDENGNLIAASSQFFTSETNPNGNTNVLREQHKPSSAASFEENDDDACDESDTYETDEDDADFGDEAFKLVADDINVNVDSLLKKLRQADTFDRRETMLKKGNVKNANIVHVEMYDDEEEGADDPNAGSDCSDDSDDGGEDGDDDENHADLSSSNASSAKRLWNKFTQRGSSRAASQHPTAASQQGFRGEFTASSLLVADPNNTGVTPIKSNLKVSSNAGTAINVSDVSLRTQDGERDFAEGKITNGGISDDTEKREDIIAHPQNVGGDSVSQVGGKDEVEVQREHLLAVEKERIAAEKASLTVEITQNSRENEDILINEIASQVKNRLTADKVSGSTIVSRPSRRSSNRFDGGEEMSCSSLRDDVSAYSLNDDGTHKPRSALKKNRSKKKKNGAQIAGFASAAAGTRGGVSFSQNEVSEVCIFEVGDELYVGVQFKRSWVGWVAAFLAILFEIIYDVHVVFIYLTTPYPIGAVQAWVGTNRFIASAVLFLVAYFAGVGVQPLKHVLSGYGILILAIMALSLSVGVSMEAVAINETGETHFYIASVLYCLWIVLYRLWIKEAVFLLEVVSILVTVAGFMICNTIFDVSMSAKDAIVGNVVLFVSSILYASYFFLLSRVRKWAPIVPMVAFQGISAISISLSLAAILGVSASDMFAFATDGTLFGHSLFIAVEGVVSNILLILTIDYLDVLSVASIFILKSATMPIFTKLITIDHFDIDPSKINDAKVSLEWYVYLGYALAIVGCVITVIFASLRRSFVSRRIASSKRKKAPNPYTKKKRRMEREAAAMGLTLQQFQEQQRIHQQQQLMQLRAEQQFSENQHHQTKQYRYDSAHQQQQYPPHHHENAANQQQPITSHQTEQRDRHGRRPSPGKRRY